MTVVGPEALRESPPQRGFFLNPGYVCVPAAPTRLAAVVSSGVAITVYDNRRKRGGMSHYTQPLRHSGRSTAIFAAPSIVELVRGLLAAGSRERDLEAHLFGGATNSTSAGYVRGLSEKNVEVGEELLRKMRVSIVGKDVGGSRARKVLFDSASGETVVARVERVRAGDWYPAA
jgi:chemotaxis protein CheD